MAENLFMRHYREKHNYSKATVANALQITEAQYADLEAGKAFLGYEKAQLLGNLYSTDAHSFYIPALQEELKATQGDVIILLKALQVERDQSPPAEEEIGEDDSDNPEEPDAIPDRLLEQVAQNPTHVI